MEEKVLQILVDISGVDDIREDRDTDLYETGLLDSLGTIELLIQIEEKLGIKIEPTEVSRDEINTPNKLIKYLSMRS